jgi:hypothetical protein
MSITYKQSQTVRETNELTGKIRQIRGMTEALTQERVESEADVDFKERLVEEVRQYELIYDKKNCQHKNRTAIVRAWLNIAETLGSTCRIQYIYLRLPVILEISPTASRYALVSK